MLDDILLLVKNLDTNGNNIKVATSNIKVLATLKSRLEKIMLNPNYIDSVKQYLKSFNQVVQLQNDYFKEIESKFKPPKLTDEIKKQAIGSVAKQLTETGLGANVVDKIQDILRKAITSGSGYTSLTKQLTDFLIDNKSGDGQLVKYTKQITTDAINQFSGQYTQLISSDLGFEWFRYSGSNIETTRPFCLACTERKWFHISELPEVLKGQFDEFRKYDGTINKKTELPEGMIPGTDISNFQIYTGGYNCMHKWRPVSEDLVPADIKQRVYASVEYKKWKGIDVPKEPIQNLDKKEKPLLLDVTGGLMPAIAELVNRSRKIITDAEKKQLISINGLEEIHKIKDAKLYATGTQKILPHELTTIKKLMELGHDVLFMPDSYFGNNKKFDVIVFQKNKYFKADIKEVKSQNANTISDSISYGGLQSGGKVIVDVHGNVPHSILTDGIISAFDKNNSLQSILVFYKNKSKTYYRDQVKSNKFPVEFYKAFVR